MLALQVQWTKFGSQNMKARCRQEATVTLLGGEKLRKRTPEPQVPAQERMYVLQVAVLQEWGYPSPLKFR